MSVERTKGESPKEYAGRLLASMFQEVYSHTGREMPGEMFDRCYDFAGEMIDAVRDEMKEASVRW